MPLAIKHLRSGKIYLEKKAIFSDRIDFAWSIYSNPLSEFADRQEALKFLIYAFDLNNFQHINEQLLTLMLDKQAHQLNNPEYIPLKSPTRLPFNPKITIPQQIPFYEKANDPLINIALIKGELLEVNNHSKALDYLEQTRFFNAKERGEWRVHIKNGLFMKNGKIFDTYDMESHKKKTFAAYTLNANGELSLFNHYGLVDQIAHSSLNSGAPVVAAGELQIKSGYLKAITTHSGHYKPSLFNVFRVLEYFTENHVDISKANVITMIDPSQSFSTIHTEPNYFIADKNYIYKTPAIQLYKTINTLINENIDSIHKQVKSYQEEGIATTIFHWKDRVMGSDLTKKRARLAANFEIILNAFKISLASDLSPQDFMVKITELEQIITDFQQKNNELSFEHHKKVSSGRLATHLMNFKSQITSLKKEDGEPDPLDFKTMKTLY